MPDGLARLKTLSPDLASKLERASDTKQNAARIAACEFAIRESGLNHLSAKKAIERIRTSNPLSPKERADLEILAIRLDDEYFALQESADKENGGGDSYLQVFARARAAYALLSAFSDDLLEASAEAIYEAAATTDEPQLIFSEIEIVL